MALKAKTYAVEFGGKTYLVQAITKAGQRGESIIGADKYARVVDPNQLNLAGIPETAGATE